MSLVRFVFRVSILVLIHFDHLRSRKKITFTHMPYGLSSIFFISNYFHTTEVNTIKQVKVMPNGRQDSRALMRHALSVTVNLLGLLSRTPTNTIN